MEIAKTLLIVVQVLSALAMIGFILMQQGKGADAGAAFGGGGSASLFGASGGANFMSRSTAVLATVFLLSTLALAYVGNAKPVQPAVNTVLEGVKLETPAAESKLAQGAGQIPGQ